MKVTYKCPKNDTRTESEAKREITERKSYDEYAAMHYGGSGWSTWNEITYEVEKCEECGKHHSIKERQVENIKMN